MMDIVSTVSEGVRLGLGLDSNSLSLYQMGVRALVVDLIAIFIVRLADKRFFGKHTALDVILGFMLGSILSRAITGNSPFFPTLCAALVLVGVHWAFAAFAYHWSRFGTLVKGSERQLVRDGQVQWDQMRAGQISRQDLLGAVRAGAGSDDLDQVESAYLERSGDISIIKRKDAPRVLEVRVEEGVQTVRLELG